MLHRLRTTTRLGLLMQISNTTPSSLKRSFAQTSSAPHQTHETLSAQRRRRSTSPRQDNQHMSLPRSHSGHSTPGPGPRTGSPSGRGALKYNSFRGHRDHSRNNSRSRLTDREKDRDTLEIPLRDENLIKQTYRDVNISTHVLDNPKSSLTEFAHRVLDTPLDFKYKVGMINKQKLWRFVFRIFNDPVTDASTTDLPSHLS